jgi:hypothetical protein
VHDLADLLDGGELRAEQQHLVALKIVGETRLDYLQQSTEQ